MYMCRAKIKKVFWVSLSVPGDLSSSENVALSNENKCLSFVIVHFFRGLGSKCQNIAHDATVLSLVDCKQETYFDVINV